MRLYTEVEVKKRIDEAIQPLLNNIEEQQREIELLKEKIAQLTKNSSNSSKPPSSDIVKPKKHKRVKGKHKQGGQKGHPRHERTPFPEEELDQIFSYQHTRCPDCGHADVQLKPDLPIRTIQQMEVKVKIIKSEHRVHPVYCPVCHTIHYHPFPECVVKEGLCQVELTALVAYMKAVVHASFSTIRKFIRDILGETISRSHLRNLIAKTTEALNAPYEELLKRLPLESTLNVDETGHKENGQRFWTWVFRADLYVLFKIDKSRGSKVLLDVLSEEFNGVLGCDYYSAYHKYMKDFNVTVQFCIAHLIRDIKYLTKLSDATIKAYGKRLLAAVKALFKVIHDRENYSSRAFDEALEQARQHIISTALTDVPSKLNKDGKETKRPAYNMAQRFRKNGDAYFRFITTPGVEPTNNLAEQAVRFVVIDRLITQGTRSDKGRRSNERLWTVVGTCAMQGRSAYQFILKAVRALFNQQPAPSLLLDSS